MKVVFIISFLVFSSILQAQIVTIPDPVFKDYLTTHICADPIGIGAPTEDVDTNNDGEIQVSEAEAVLGLFIEEASITSLTGIESFANLQVISLSQLEIENLDLSQNTTLETLFTRSNPITAVSLPQGTNLKDIHFSQSPLTYLDVTQNPNLERIHASNNQLASIDVSQNPVLEALICFDNEISSLDVSQNPELTHLEVSDNQLTSLDVTQNLDLIYLHFINNQLESIDTSMNPDLKQLWTGKNPITNLDLSQNPMLEFLSCWENNLTTLNLTQNNVLDQLRCYGNPNLKELDLRNQNNTMLWLMHANLNPNLNCILVDDASYSNSQPCTSQGGWCKDELTIYSENEDCILAIDDVQNNAVELFPNPIKNVLYINSDKTIEKIVVYNQMGVLVEQTNKINSKLNVSNLASGLYFAIISMEGNTFIKKFIKN